MLAQSAGMRRAVRSDVPELWANGIAKTNPDKVRDAKAVCRRMEQKESDSQIQDQHEEHSRKGQGIADASADRLVKATPKEHARDARSGA